MEVLLTWLCLWRRHPDDVDLFTGGTSEESVKDGIVGELFAHIIGQQFHDLKYGDRYYFETDSTYYGFTTGKLSVKQNEARSACAASSNKEIT